MEKFKTPPKEKPCALVCICGGIIPANCRHRHPQDPSTNQTNLADFTSGNFRQTIVQSLFHPAAADAVARRSHRTILDTFASWLLRVQEQRGRRLLLLWKIAHRSLNRLLAGALGRWCSSSVDQARLACLSRTIILDAAFTVWQSPDPSQDKASPLRMPEERAGHAAVALRLRFRAAGGKSSSKLFQEKKKNKQMLLILTAK
jgi:hypothetical protein